MGKLKMMSDGGFINLACVFRSLTIGQICICSSNVGPLSEPILSNSISVGSELTSLYGPVNLGLSLAAIEKGVFCIAFYQVVTVCLNFSSVRMAHLYINALSFSSISKTTTDSLSHLRSN